MYIKVTEIVTETIHRGNYKLYRNQIADVTPFNDIHHKLSYRKTGARWPQFYMMASLGSSFCQSYDQTVAFLPAGPITSAPNRRIKPGHPHSTICYHL